MFISCSRRLVTSLHPHLSSFLQLRKLQTDTKILKRYGFVRPQRKQKLRSETSPGSRYAPPKQEERTEDIALSTLRDKNFMNVEEWNTFKSDLMEQNDCVSEENFGTIVMNALLSSNQLNLSHSLMQYLEQCNVKPNFLTYLKYLTLCSKNFRLLDETHIPKIIDKVKPLIDGSPVIDMKRAEYIIQGLCATNRWKESFNYLSKLTGSKPNAEICNALACAAIRNGDENLAWDILTNWIKCLASPMDRTAKEFLLAALNMQKSNPMGSDKLVFKLFNFMQAQNLVMSEEAAELVEKYFKCHRLKWNITYTKVSRKGVCSACGHKLLPADLNCEEFERLRQAFLEKVVKKSDLFINTTAKEFENYMKFIDFHKPFHIVLDGLNAAYSYQGVRNKKCLSYHLLHVIQVLYGKTRNILVLGKKHMCDWPKNQMIKISQRAKLFFTDNISQDDPYVVYAALASGPHTLYLSDDLMRDHISRLEDPKLIQLFKKWQLSHQIFIECDDLNTIKLIEPVRHCIVPQGDLENGWHIPFDDKIILDPYEELNNWLCIRRMS